MDMRGDRRGGRGSAGSWRLERVSCEAAATETEPSEETPRFSIGLFLLLSPTMEYQRVAKTTRTLSLPDWAVSSSPVLTPSPSAGGKSSVQHSADVLVLLLANDVRASRASRAFHSAGILFSIYLYLNIERRSVFVRHNASLYILVTQITCWSLYFFGFRFWGLQRDDC